MPIFHLLLCSVVIFFVLYAPQPMLAQFAEHFAITPAKSGLLMTVTMLPLAVAPIFYGLVLTRFCKLIVLRNTMIALALCCTVIGVTQQFELFLAMRFIEGLLLPAALTSMTGYIGQTWQGQCLRKNMTWYVGSTIAGGYLGRALAANFATWWGFESFYLFNAVLLLVLALMVKPTYDKSTSQAPITSPRAYLKPLKSAKLLRLYGAVFCMFYCFSALLNYLPFILSNEYQVKDPKLIAWIYSGYLVGALISMVTPLLSKLTHNNWQILTTLFAIYSLTLLAMQWSSLSFFVAMFTLFCACMFMIHASAAPLANELSTANASITNGAYVSFYYCGGALGTFVPGFIYQIYGLAIFLISLLFVCMFGGYLVLQNQRTGSETQCGV
ncbi:MFS transporter [Pseudoalteromonas luteoviolacea]|uniref:MFS transporter n=1 Tax=Pseudoalteromonas luteoviolacea TaxID=43657 RepID=UPI001B39CA09|nr:MFS transporter [Pseudoalteromonas luteoviolacea]MBQ4837401.1 MFS transporter [Pseudoalteromonas luteoviolacea]